MIEDMYEKDQSPHFFELFKNQLLRLYDMAKHEIQRDIFFPKEFIFNKLELYNRQFFFNREPQFSKCILEEVDCESNEWHPFWHVKFFLAKDISSADELRCYLWKITHEEQKDNSLNSKRCIPEKFFSSMYLGIESEKLEKDRYGLESMKAF